MASSLTTIPLAELQLQLNARAVSAVEVATAHLDQIQHHDNQIHAFVHVNRDSALRQAAAIDQKRASGQEVGLLAGIPVAVKDLLCTVGEPTTCGSRILEKFVPPYDAHAITRLRQADAVLIGRTNMDEFAMGSSGENSAFGPTRNPWDTERIPGGSSSGSAAAVAARMAPLALGSDTGGSIRQPAALCGIVGLKPTYGRVSRYGLIAYASSLDQIGPLATDVHGAALLLEAIAGHDPRDSTSVQQPASRYSQTFEQPLRGLRIGVPVEHFAEGLDPEIERSVRHAYELYKTLGAELIDVHLPHSRYAVSTYYLVATSEASSNLSRYDGVHYGHRSSNAGHNLVEMYEASRGEGFGAEVKRRIMLGVFSLSAGYADKFYTKALQVRRMIRGDFDAAFEKVDVIAGPVTPTAAFKLGEKTSDPLAMYLSDIYTISANLAGIPGISVPCGMTSTKLPIGLQLLAPPFEEDRLLRAARMFERETQWHREIPQLAAR
ncbi:Asp-tRNA(Asn)/Glu-tRNA(Gln) amidotransferase subunit GatA [Schlesneria paludicola]|uniref:Asp-tRNA(Asn)/Glu-tRNA(Gln) amidotransferase subunit GatA n=1 Tax=Schlesneria paludicola TaxID=360056 RepID=UPI00029AA963|nr:Asp-tRNA(Asn)/Glu-tRNA(Gln) amidotransferase subunit GatA [Schlesneria paludicola]